MAELVQGQFSLIRRREFVALKAPISVFVVARGVTLEA